MSCAAAVSTTLEAPVCNYCQKTLRQGQRAIVYYGASGVVLVHLPSECPANGDYEDDPSADSLVD